MKFTLIIPTKNRRETAIKAVKSGTMSRYDDIEIIVTDGSDDDSLGKEIKKLEDPRIKYFHHTKSLSMKNNWEFGVSKATGDYVSVIGDDDALMPDGFLFAAELIKLSGTNVLHCKCPNYKWPDYTLVSRRNLIELKLPTTVMYEANPRSQLRRAYEFEARSGTGPGIYHGIISKKFLDDLKSMRGSYFIDDNPDFDSGFCTLLYAESYLQTSYPLFISGQCAASNSGAMNTKAVYHQGLSDFVEDSSSEREEVMWSELENLVSIEAGLVSCLRRFLPEVNKVLPGKKIKLNKQNIFNLIAGGIAIGYENTTFKAEVEILKKIAKKWRVSPKAIPTRKQPTIGLLADKGINKSAIAEENKQINRLMIDGNLLGVNGILDAIKVVESSTVDWVILLNSLGHIKGVSFPARDKPNSIDLVLEKLQKENHKEAKNLLEENIMSNPLDEISLRLLGIMYFNQNDFGKAIPNLARSLSFEFDIQTFDAYFHSLVKTNQLDCARLVLENYSKELAKINSQLNEHCSGVLEMASGNYSAAANIFSNIKPQIDSSLYFYCAAHAKFSKGDAINADKLVKKALHLNENKKEFLELEANIDAIL